MGPGTRRVCVCVSRVPTWPGAVVRMLNNVPLYGSPISLVISSHLSVKLPRPGTEEVRVVLAQRQSRVPDLRADAVVAVSSGCAGRGRTALSSAGAELQHGQLRKVRVPPLCDRGLQELPKHHAAQHVAAPVEPAARCYGGNAPHALWPAWRCYAVPLLPVRSVATLVSTATATHLRCTRNVVVGTPRTQTSRGTTRMAIVQMSQLGEAVDALVAMHQYPLTDRNRIRVSFAKAPGNNAGNASMAY